MTKKKETEIIVDEETIATVTETTTGSGHTTKKAVYPAKVKQNEIETDDENDNQNDYQESENEFENFEGFDEGETFEEIPKSQIDVMFDRLLEVDSFGNQSFYAMILRLPDAMSDNFKIRCQNQMPLGTQIFSIRDRFIFQSALQKLNNNSGMRCAIRVCDEGGQEITVKRRIHFHTSWHPVGIAHLVIPNPIVAELKETTSQNNSEFSELLREMREDRQANERKFELLRNELTKPREPSMLEKALEQKMINDIANPPQGNNSNLEQTLATMFTMPVIVEKMASKMFPEAPAPPAEQSILEKFFTPQVAETIANKGMDLIGTFGNSIATAIETRTLASLTPEQKKVVEENRRVMYEEDFDTENPQLNPQMEAQNEQQKQMIELVTKITSELESENPINTENTLIEELSNEFPMQYGILKMACQNTDFEIILEQLANIAPDAIKPYIDEAFISESGQIISAEGKLIFNTDKGLNMKARLLELYNFLKG